MLFEVERDLLVADAPQQRTREEPIRDRAERDADDDPEGEDGRRGEPQRLQPEGGGEQRDDGQRDRGRRAAHRQLQAPPPSHVADDADKIVGHDHLASYSLIPNAECRMLNAEW